MASLRPSTPAGTTSSSAKELAERAARIAAMLDRWASEDVSGEPDWSVDDLEPVALRRSDADAKPRP
jgi:hypothetical protein